jgi:hypothetical protein
MRFDAIRPKRVIDASNDEPIRFAHGNPNSSKRHRAIGFDAGIDRQSHLGSENTK